MRKTKITIVMQEYLQQHPGKTICEMPMSLKVYTEFNIMIDNEVFDPEVEGVEFLDYFKQFSSFPPYLSCTFEQYLLYALAIEELPRSICALMLQGFPFEERACEDAYRYTGYENIISQIFEYSSQVIIPERLLIKIIDKCNIIYDRVFFPDYELFMDLVSNLPYLSRNFIHVYEPFLNQNLLKRNGLIK